VTAGPRRVKVRGDLYHGQVPDGAVYVGRQAPGLKRSKFANPFPVRVHGREEAIRLYRDYLLTPPRPARSGTRRGGRPRPRLVVQAG